MGAFTTISAKGISNKLSDVINDGADFGPDTDGTKTSGMSEAIFNSKSGNIALLGGRFAIREKLIVNEGINMFGGQRSILVNETDDFFEPFVLFKPYTYVDFLVADANKKSGIQVGLPNQNNFIKIGTLKVYNVGDIYSNKYGAQSSVVIRGYNVNFDYIDIDGGNTGLVFNECADIMGNSVQVVNCSTGINIISAEHIWLSNFTVDSCRYVGMQIDSSHDIGVKGKLWNNASAYPENKLVIAVQLGKYSGTNENLLINGDIKVIGTGGTALYIGNSKLCTFNLQIINTMLNVKTQKIEVGIQFGENNYDNILNGSINGVDKPVVGKPTGKIDIAGIV